MSSALGWIDAQAYRSAFDGAVNGLWSPFRVNFYHFDGHRTMSGMPPKADLFRQNVWIAPNIGLFSPPMKTGILCHQQTLMAF
jgi:hypothetical protein